ncbi:hypothetical protein BMS3Bbin08_00027 [bacterium BMS3Bbin08]|nr:hypothetical protein BMS3Bbin08_00027 [bacterium BMS3Bbin08]
MNFRATSFATSFTGLPSNSISNISATLYSFFTSVILKSLASPSATASSVIAMSRAWSEWAAVPAAIILSIFLAATVGSVAPQTPLASSSAFLPISLQGPMWQTLQHAPVSPIGHCFSFSARSKHVSILWDSPHSIISSADSPALLITLLIYPP